MVVLRNFWTPCYWYDDVKVATTTIAFYTAMMSIVIIAYTSYVINGGESSQHYMPYFETDLRDSTQWVGALSIIFFLLFIAFSYMMFRGVRIENRGLIIPWLCAMSMVIIYQLVYGFSLLFKYYIYLESVFVTLCVWLWMSYNIYCLLCIYSYYQILKEKQSPNIVLLYP